MNKTNTSEEKLNKEIIPKADKVESDLYVDIQTTSYNLSDMIQIYSQMVDLRRKDFLELTQLLLSFWSLDDDLSTALEFTNICFDIEEKIIELGKIYDT